MDIPILFEDEDILIIDKPSGIVVNSAESVAGETVQEWAEEYRKSEDGSRKTEGEEDFYNRAGIVHRLDKETSGVLLIAKTPQAFSELQRQFKERTVKKTYLALVHGNVVPKEGEISAAVGRLPWNRKRFGIVPGGKEAVTTYKVMTNDQLPMTNRKPEEISLLELHPQTGRTHQIRVHLKYINHPIVGDFQYAGRKTSRSDRQTVPRVMLHAWKISFTHPKTGQRLDLTAPIPTDFSPYLAPHPER